MNHNCSGTTRSKNEDNRGFWSGVIAIVTIVVLIIAVAWAEDFINKRRYGFEEAIANHNATIECDYVYLLQSPVEEGITAGRVLLKKEYVTCTGDTFCSLPIGGEAKVLMVKVVTEEGVDGWISVHKIQISMG